MKMKTFWLCLWLLLALLVSGAVFYTLSWRAWGDQSFSEASLYIWSAFAFLMIIGIGIVQYRKSKRDY